MIEVTLYTKADCSLCDEAKHLLQGLQSQYPHRLTEVDITADPALFDRFRTTIPVVQVGEMLCQAPITAVDLQRLLAAHSA